MTAHSVIRPKQIIAFKFGGADFSDDDFSSTSVALDTAFTTNNPAIPQAGSANTNAVQLNLVGTRAHLATATATACPAAYSEAFAKDITYSGNERSVTEDNLLGANTDGAQNQEVDIAPNSLLEVTATIVYRNPIPSSIFNDNTKCCIIEMDNGESASSGLINHVFKSITVLSVGSTTLSPEGMMEQTVKFSCKGGTTGTSIVVETGTEVWYRVKGGDFADETRVA